MRRIEELRAMLREILSAQTQAELSALYVRHVGYCPFADDENAEFENVRETLADFIREICYSEGIHWADVSG